MNDEELCPRLRADRASNRSRASRYREVCVRKSCVVPLQYVCATSVEAVSNA